MLIYLESKRITCQVQQTCIERPSSLSLSLSLFLFLLHSLTFQIDHESMNEEIDESKQNDGDVRWDVDE